MNYDHVGYRAGWIMTRYQLRHYWWRKSVNSWYLTIYAGFLLPPKGFCPTWSRLKIMLQELDKLYPATNPHISTNIGLLDRFAMDALSRPPESATLHVLTLQVLWPMSWLIMALKAFQVVYLQTIHSLASWWMITPTSSQLFRPSKLWGWSFACLGNLGFMNT